jgi:hypothetical protein
MRRFISGAIVAGVITVGGAGLISAGAGAAYAGEVTGNGRITPVSDEGGFVAGSICAFSGLDDGSESGLGVQPGVTQSWGTGVNEVAKGGGVGAYAQAGVLHDEGPGSNCLGYASGRGGGA